MQPNTQTPEKRGPGRPRKDRAERRRRGAAETTGSRLGVDPSILDHGTYAYHLFNDRPGRLAAKTKRDDWDFVPADGEKEVGTDLGAAISFYVGTNPDGSPQRAYLCRKLKTYFDEDRADAQAKLDEQLAQLRSGNTRDGASQSDYVPNEGIRLG